MHALCTLHKPVYGFAALSGKLEAANEESWYMTISYVRLYTLYARKNARASTHTTQLGYMFTFPCSKQY